MPNNVHCFLRATGSSKAIDALVAAVASPESACAFDFYRIIPQPPCIYHGMLGEQQESEHPNRNWYAWCVRRWGTKWPAYSVTPPTRFNNGGVAEWRFETAWCVPYPVFSELAFLFPDVAIYVAYVCELDEWAGEINVRWSESLGNVDLDDKPIVADSNNPTEDFERVFELAYGQSLDSYINDRDGGCTR